MAMNRGIVFTMLPVLGVVGVLLWQGSGAGTAVAAAVPDSSTFVVRRGDLDITIVENGTLVAKESQKVVPRFRGEGKVVFLAEEGKSVQEGEVICRIDSTTLQSQVEQQEMDIVQAEAALVTAKTEQEIQVSDNAATIEKANITLEFVRMELEKNRDGDAPQDRRTLEVGIKDAETEFNRAQKRFEDSKKLLEQDFIKHSELEQHEIDYEKATVKLEAARRALELFEKYTRPMNLRKFTNAVTDAERDVETAQKRAKSKLNQREADTLQAEKRLKRLKEQLEERRKDLENMTLKAPCPGILIYGDPREPWYREQVKVGGSIWGGNTMMTIPDLRVMQVKIQVHEADINKVALGQPAIVTMETYPGLNLHGEVARIANIAAAGNPWMNTESEVKRFDVEIVIKDTGELKLKPGISAKAQIHVERRRDTIFVPLQCVFIEGGVPQCLVVGTDGPQRRQVQLGTNSDTYMEILSGLEPGERVLLHNPLLGKDGKDGKSGKEAAPGAAGDAPGDGNGAAAGAVPVDAAATPGAATPAAASAPTTEDH
jgi:HlyD family secretion protein